MLKDLSSPGTFAIRDAELSDSEFIARNVLAAMGYEVFSDSQADSVIEFGSTTLKVRDAVKALAEVCARTDTIYSYSRTRIACVNDKPVGSLTAYSGGDYLPLRDLTWGLLDSVFEGMASPAPAVLPQATSGMDRANESSDNEYVGEPSLASDPECHPGEFYLDSMAVLPDYRSMAFEYSGSTDRIGHLLMLDGIDEGRRKGFPLVSLIVDKQKPRLKAYYSALGFRPDGDILFLGHPYDRMIKGLD